MSKLRLLTRKWWEVARISKRSRPLCHPSFGQPGSWMLLGSFLSATDLSFPAAMSILSNAALADAPGFTSRTRTLEQNGAKRTTEDTPSCHLVQECGLAEGTASVGFYNNSNIL